MIPACDGQTVRQTVGQTESIIANTALCIASYADYSNRIESYFCRSAVGGQPISLLVTSSLCIQKDVSSISVLTCNGNGSYGTEERQRNGGK